MEISQTAIGLLYLYGTLLGAGAGLFYDFLRITRIFLGVHYSRSAIQQLQKIRLPILAPYHEHEENAALGVVIFLEDFFFCILSGIALTILFYECNDGKIRLPVFATFALGFFLYRATLGRLVMLLSEYAAFFLESAVRYLFYFLFYPFRTLGKLLYRLGKRLILKIQSDLWHHSRIRFYKSELRDLKQGKGLFPPSPKQKRGKTNEKRKKDPIQSFHGAQNFLSDPCSAFCRRVRNKRHEVQSASGRRT